MLAALVTLCATAAFAATPDTDPLTVSNMRAMAAINLTSLVVVVGFAVIAIRRRSYWSLQEFITKKAAEKASEDAAADVAEQLKGAPEVLRCAACGSAVAPSSSSTTACPSCATKVDVPAEYVKLAQARVAAAEALAHDVRAMRRVELLTHPLWAPLWVVGAVALGYALVRLNNIANAAPNDSLVGLFGAQWLALLIVPVGMVISGAGQLGAWSELSEVKTSFAARRDDKIGWTCRRCGAPLSSHDGVSAVCGYCSAQNLLRAAAQRETEDKEKLMHSLAAQVTHARAVQWHWFWRGLQVPSFLLAAIGGLLFLSFGLIGLIALHDLK